MKGAAVFVSRETKTMMAQFRYQVTLINEMKVIGSWTNFPAEIQFISQEFHALGR